MDFYSTNHPQLTDEDFELHPVKNSVYAKFDEVKLIAKILSVKGVGFNYLKNVIIKHWGIKGKISTEKRDFNICIIKFSDSKDLEHVWKNRPWNVLGKHIILQKWEEVLKNPAIMDFTTFWVRIYNFPPMFISEDNATKVGRKIWVVESVILPNVQRCEKNEDELFMRVRITMSISNPIQPGFHFYLVDREPVWVAFRYEKLSDICYSCGLLSHEEANCENPNKLKSRLGGWIKAHEYKIADEDGGNDGAPAGGAIIEQGRFGKKFKGEGVYSGETKVADFETQTEHIHQKGNGKDKSDTKQADYVSSGSENGPMTKVYVQQSKLFEEAKSNQLGPTLSKNVSNEISPDTNKNYTSPDTKKNYTSPDTKKNYTSQSEIKHAAVGSSDVKPYFSPPIVFGSVDALSPFSRALVLAKEQVPQDIMGENGGNNQEDGEGTNDDWEEYDDLDEGGDGTVAEGACEIDPNQSLQRS